MLPRQHPEAGALLQRPVERADHVLVGDHRAAVAVADGPAVDGHRALVDQALLDQLADDRRHAAGVVVVLAEILAGRLQVDEQRDLLAVGLPVLDRRARRRGGGRWR